MMGPPRLQSAENEYSGRLTILRIEEPLTYAVLMDSCTLGQSNEVT